MINKLTVFTNPRLPKIIRETLGDEIADQMQKVVDEAPPRPPFVIYGNNKFFDAIDAALDDYIENCLSPFKT